MRVPSMSNLTQRRTALQAIFLFICIFTIVTTGVLANPQNAGASVSVSSGATPTNGAGTSSGSTPTTPAGSSSSSASDSSSPSATSTPSGSTDTTTDKTTTDKTTSDTSKSTDDTSAAASMHVSSFGQTSLIISLSAVTAGAAKLLL